MVKLNLQLVIQRGDTFVIRDETDGIHHPSISAGFRTYYHCVYSQPTMEGYRSQHNYGDFDQLGAV